MPLSFPLWPIAAIWALVALLTAGQQLVLGRLGAAGPGALPSTYGLVVLWAIATPFVLQSAARWPIPRRQPWSALARHALLGGAFVVATNVVIRLPGLWSDPVSLLASTGRGLATYGPYAMLAYGAIVAIGHAIGPVSTDQPAAPPVVPDPPSSLVVRESDVTRVIPLETIAWVAADDNYVRIHSAGETVRARM